MKKIQPKTLPGFMELMPKEQILFNNIKEIIQKTYEKYGFLPIDTPVIEAQEVLLAKAGGETEKQIYSFSKGENELCLRFDLTVPLAKYVAEYYNELTFPFRRYQIGKVYRGERPQRGRYREFYQCDIDVIGDGELSLLHDAEMPSIIYEIFKEIGLKEFCIYINNRKILSGIFEHINAKEISQDIMRIIDKIDKIGEEKVVEELKNINLNEEAINTIVEFINIKGSTDEIIDKLKTLKIENETFVKGVEEITEVVKNIRLFNVPDEYFNINLSIARGLDYYTGTVYETFLTNHREVGSVCSGGRYNDLAGFYTEKELPGVGISIGLSRLFFVLNDLNLIKQTKKSISNVIIISMIEDLSYSIKTANALREKNINTEIYFEDKKIKSKFKYTDKLEIPYAIIIGEDEVNSGKLTLKNMQTGEQNLLTIEEAMKIINM